ncbi:MAG: hypothetical protein AB7E37_04045 [Candidatus Altimarinota bacterium]
MNIKANIFERKKRELLNEDMRYMILTLQYYIDKNEDLNLVYNLKNNEFLFYHENNFKLKSKNEKLIYTLKNGAKKEKIDYSDTYNNIFSNLDNDKNYVKDFLSADIQITDEEFEDFYNTLQDIKKETKNELSGEGFLNILSEENKTFNTFLDKILHLEYILEKHHSFYLRKIEIFLKKLKYEDIIK